jgi:hypothetical protein
MNVPADKLLEVGRQIAIQIMMSLGCFAQTHKHDRQQ